jgi:hypothetical protein
VTGADGAAGDDGAHRRREEEERRRRRKDDAADVEDLVEAPGMVCDGCSLARRTCSGRRGGGGSDGCDACDLLLMSLSLAAVLQVVAGVLPRRRGASAVVALIRGYQRLLTRFTPSCPQTPSCSAYAVDAVRRWGPRRGIHAAAARIRSCGMPPA